MKELDKTKTYDLSQLNDEQFYEVRDYLIKQEGIVWKTFFNIGNKNIFISFSKCFGIGLIRDYKNEDLTNAIELFKN